MIMKSFEDYTIADVPKLLLDNVDSVILVDAPTDQYKALLRKGFFEQYIEESGSYHDLIIDLWFHFDGSSEQVSSDYQIFADNTGDFRKKYSRRLNIVTEQGEKPHLVQLTVYPLVPSEKYLFLMDEFDDNESLQESLTSKKIRTIQSSYLFSMYIDLVLDTTSSINVAEMSDNVVNYNLKYSDWRMMIVNMFLPEDQELFLRRTDPEYLKKNFPQGRTASFDCMMRNLEGKFIWVKLIFSRAQTNDDSDYRFVFMVQDIHENSMEMLSTLKKYEEMAITDPLTGVYNHGEIESQLHNALAMRVKNDEPVSIMMIDLDLFKKVNDNYGHAVGDTTLKHLAKIMTDISLEEKCSVGRWGGEEFVIVCYGKSGEQAAAIAEKLRHSVDVYEFPEIMHITCSIGVTEITGEDDFQEAFNRLDRAMYASKHNGRNMVTKL